MEINQNYFISLILSYKVRRNIDLLHCTSNQARIGNKLHFQPKHPDRAKLEAINNINGCGTAEVWWRKSGSVSYHWYSHIRSGKRHICSVVPWTKPAQAITSIFGRNIQLGPKWQQSTAKMSVAWMRCNVDSFDVFLILDTIIYGQEKYIFAPL